MHLDLADILRCPRDHEESALVVVARDVVGRQLFEGTLGCPVCASEYPVVGGVADFRLERAASAPPAEPAPSDAARVMRAAALLGLGEARKVVLLTGEAGDVAAPLGDLVPLVAIVADPASPPRPAEHVSTLLTGGRLPLAPRSLHGALLDVTWLGAGGLALDACVRALRAGGRLVAPVELALPEGVRELARDDREWVAERVAPPTRPVPLTLAR